MAKTFIVTFEGADNEITAGQLEDAIWHGLERNEIEWSTYSVVETKEVETND